MKYIVNFCFILAAACISLSSCASVGDDVIWDIAPIDVQIYVNNADGENLIDPDETEGTLDITKITAEWEGETYSVSTEESGPQTKYYLPHFCGLTVNADSFGKWRLCFGELDGQENMDNRKLVIHWGDGSSDTITIFNKFKWKANGDPSITRRFYLNGEKLSSDIATFKLVK